MTSNPSMVLAVNAGSSSLKAALIKDGEAHVASFLGERLMTSQAQIHIKYQGNRATLDIPDGNHAQALEKILAFLKEQPLKAGSTATLMDSLVATGHRVVHGGSSFSESTLVTEEVLQEIEKVSPLAPLHNPHNLKGIRSVQAVVPKLPAVAVFDTAFHSTLPEKARLYPLPKTYRDQGMRKYGFHGTSVQYVSQQATKICQSLRPGSVEAGYRLVVCHLGNGASVTAVDSNGKSVETSMGFSPLQGLMMGTRSGSIDPAIVPHAVHALDKTVDEVLHDLNKQSGLKAMTEDGEFDMRVLLERRAQSLANKDKEEEDKGASMAVDMFVYRLVQHIASSVVALSGPLDALVFTAGIGEHAAVIRQLCVEQLQKTIAPTLILNADRNTKDGNESNGVLTNDGTWPVVLDIATDEEVMIALDCLRLVEQK